MSYKTFRFRLDEIMDLLGCVRLTYLYELLGSKGLRAITEVSQAGVIALYDFLDSH